MFIRAILSYTALCVALFSMAIFGLSLFILAVPYRLFLGWWLGRWIKNPLDYIPWLWTEFVWYVCFRGLMRVELKVTHE